MNMADVPYTEFKGEEEMGVAMAPREESAKDSPPPEYSPPTYSNPGQQPQPAYPTQQACPSQQAYPSQPPYPSQPAYPTQQAYPPQQAYPNQHPVNQPYSSQPQYSMQTVTVVQPQGAVVDVPRVNRLRAQARHVVFVVFSWVVLYLFMNGLSIFLAPLPAVAFALALTSLWKQERGEARTSNILGWISLAFSILSVVAWCVTMAFVLAYA